MADLKRKLIELAELYGSRNSGGGLRLRPVADSGIAISNKGGDIVTTIVPTEDETRRLEIVGKLYQPGPLYPGQRAMS